MERARSPFFFAGQREKAEDEDLTAEVSHGWIPVLTTRWPRQVPTSKSLKSARG